MARYLVLGFFSSDSIGQDGFIYPNGLMIVSEFLIQCSALSYFGFLPSRGTLNSSGFLSFGVSLDRSDFLLTLGPLDIFGFLTSPVQIK